MGEFSALLATLNGILWHEYVLYAIVGTGVLFTVWSGFCQYRALTHGPRVMRGVYDDPNDPGAINHFQALSAALSATVGLGNIGGVALAIALGGPGAVFWMWIIGFLGMAIKLTEVTLSMLYRNTDDPDNPHGGPMWVAAKALERRGMGGLGRAIGVIFCMTLLVSTATGGNMFQAWNVGELTEEYFSVPSSITGIVLAIIVGAVIIGGIKRIGKVAGNAGAADGCPLPRRRQLRAGRQHRPDSGHVRADRQVGLPANRGRRRLYRRHRRVRLPVRPEAGGVLERGRAGLIADRALGGEDRRTGTRRHRRRSRAVHRYRRRLYVYSAHHPVDRHLESRAGCHAGASARRHASGKRLAVCRRHRYPDTTGLRATKRPWLSKPTRIRRRA